METVNFMGKRFKMVGYTFVGKLYHCAVTKSKFVIVPPGFDGLADTDSFSVKTL
jgi:hypothetical protein